MVRKSRQKYNKNGFDGGEAGGSLAEASGRTCTHPWKRSTPASPGVLEPVNAQAHKTVTPRVRRTTTMIPRRLHGTRRTITHGHASRACIAISSTVPCTIIRLRITVLLPYPRLRSGVPSALFRTCACGATEGRLAAGGTGSCARLLIFDFPKVAGVR